MPNLVALAVGLVAMIACAAVLVWYVRWVEREAEKRIDRILRRIEAEGKAGKRWA